MAITFLYEHADKEHRKEDAEEGATHEHQWSDSKKKRLSMTVLKEEQAKCGPSPAFKPELILSTIGCSSLSDLSPKTILSLQKELRDVSWKRDINTEPR